MIDLIGRLLADGHAYAAPSGSVYFDARTFPSYGELSGNRLDSLRPGHRSGGAVEPDKRFHADWALWKAAPAERELTWPAPWGTGFPGWHTECSAMSLHYLGDVIDIHTGGIDLRFPHHEDERAQSDTVAGHEVVRHWVHGEHLLFEGRKMAKSTGNVVLLADLAGRELDPLALRLAFLEQRYRQQMNLTWDALAGANRTVRRWRERVADWARSPSKAMCAQYVQQFTAAFDDDLDTPAAIRALRALEKDSDIPPGSKFETFAHADRLLGLDLARDIGRPPAPSPLPSGAADLLGARAAARQAEDWPASDRLRDELAALGVTVTDTPRGQTWAVRPT
jgi:cysteinyl-tRNA synthetase